MFNLNSLYGDEGSSQWNHCGPSQMAEKDWELQPKDLSFADIYIYIFQSKSAKTLEELKTYKSLEAYSSWVAGHTNWAGRVIHSVRRR